MKTWIADSLRRFADYLAPQKTEVSEVVEVAAAVSLLNEEVNKIKKTVENLSLLTGLHRGISTLGRRK